MSTTTKRSWVPGRLVHLAAVVAVAALVAVTAACSDDAGVAASPVTAPPTTEPDPPSDELVQHDHGHVHGSRDDPVSVTRRTASPRSTSTARWSR